MRKSGYDRYNFIPSGQNYVCLSLTSHDAFILDKNRLIFFNWNVPLLLDLIRELFE